MSDLKIYYDGNAHVLAKSLDDVRALATRLEYEIDEDEEWREIGDWESFTSPVKDEETDRIIPFNEWVEEIIASGEREPTFFCVQEY